MKPVRRAVIDVGTNSIKLLVADIVGAEGRPVLEESHQTRLGKGFYDTRRLQPEPINNTAKAVALFAASARQQRASAIRVIATSAARDALNAGELTAAIERAAGLKVEIISGDQEADLAFQGATSDPALADEPLLLLDVGGGSSEFILGRGRRKQFARSFPLGTVRLLESIAPSDPPRPAELAGCRRRVGDFMRGEVAPRIDPILRAEGKAAAPGAIRLVGTGGTATILARMEARLDRYDRDRLESIRLSRERLKWHVEHLWGLPLEKRKEIVGLPKNRADVILTGVVIYEAILDEFGFKELCISTRGLRFAAVREG